MSQYLWYKCGATLENKSKMCNKFFSFEASFLRKSTLNFLRLCMHLTMSWLNLDYSYRGYYRRSQYKLYVVDLWVKIKHVILKIYFINGEIVEYAGHHTAYTSMFSELNFHARFSTYFRFFALRRQKWSSLLIVEDLCCLRNKLLI